MCLLTTMKTIIQTTQQSMANPDLIKQMTYIIFIFVSIPFFHFLIFLSNLFASDIVCVSIIIVMSLFLYFYGDCVQSIHYSIFLYFDKV